LASIALGILLGFLIFGTFSVLVNNKFKRFSASERFFSCIREEENFDDFTALKKQIKIDVSNAKKYFN
jgi:FAD synthase